MITYILKLVKYQHAVFIFLIWHQNDDGMYYIDILCGFNSVDQILKNVKKQSTNILSIRKDLH